MNNNDFRQTISSHKRLIIFSSAIVIFIALLVIVATVPVGSENPTAYKQATVSTSATKSGTQVSLGTTNQIASSQKKTLLDIFLGFFFRPSTTKNGSKTTATSTAKSTTTTSGQTQGQKISDILNGLKKTPEANVELAPTNQTTTVFTIAALDLGIDKSVNYMKLVCQRYAVQPGFTQVQVTYPASLDPTGDRANGSIQTGVTNLDKLIRSTPGPKIVFGYSQGAQVAGAWLRKYAYAADAPLPTELSFLLIGNPERKYGKQPWVEKVTPDDTKYSVRDVSRKNDNWADWHGSATDNRFAALFGTIHTDYWNTNPYDPAAEIIKVAGNTTYVLVP